MTSTTADPPALHRRRDADPETGVDAPLDDDISKKSKWTKRRKELAAALVIGQWILPLIFYIFAPREIDFGNKYIHTALCNGVLVMVVGYLVQGGIELWHIRPTIVWALLPLLFQLLAYEPNTLFIVLMVISFPKCVSKLNSTPRLRNISTSRSMILI